MDEELDIYTGVYIPIQSITTHIYAYKKSEELCVWLKNLSSLLKTFSLLSFLNRMGGERADNDPATV